ncbi:hypothetical protein [Mycobacterium sp. SMC-4]|uniref:hypothetical protein n=1 Tax=Mycobacterium sp. SMC-4 TaxID=2857059 RepID=UPI0021B3ED6B|nr:hypothetical protein [Mycobacterium sp. SMC-4]UXA19603.1 hypothetical protein KXD98_08385 [Mycobacterium sp. SMC-4]
MTISLTEPMTDTFVLPSRHSWWDDDAQCTLVLSQPALDRELWFEYLEGAERSYHKFGVGRAIDIASISDGHDTALFWAALDRSGRVIGGVRAKGPLTCAEDSHAVVEWEGQPGLAAVRKMIDDRVPFGVLEMKAAFVDDRPQNSKGVTSALARSGSHSMAVMDVQFCMATSAPHVLDKWRTSGGVVAAIPATPYPDPRYRTKMMWWDRRTWIRHAEPGQVAKILADVRDLERAGVTYGGSAALRDNAL